MKNLKKISRDQLKQVKGGAGYCKPGYKYICYDIGICDPSLGEYCSCECVPYT
ncbi:anaerobic ribonucleoside-triphosphate reductase large subunit [Chryseobacterium sp. StRB126]|uniref:bacteriocin-like protein n=1 Tax=Chryseobacterium sp. StRB126 TaxID=878220 RepID=UPI0004E9924C|nr:anaerobic ribonucleoside-triphosphate reductase large subunit [Chryseobacterium sp. StRB126]